MQKLPSLWYVCACIICIYSFSDRNIQSHQIYAFYLLFFLQNKLGNLHYETGNLKAALKAYHEGLEVELAVLEPGNANVWVTYTNIAEIHKQQLEYKLALESYEKVLALQRKYCEDKLEIASTLSSIGYVRHLNGDYPGALDANQECLSLRREEKGDIDEDVAATLTHIALIVLKVESSQKMALELLTESYRIRKMLNSTENRDIAFTLYNIALIFHHQSLHDEALLYYNETARIERAALGGTHRDLSITYYNIAQIHYQRGDMELALTNFHEALKIEREHFGPNHPTVARTLNEIGNLRLLEGNLSEMMKYYADALRIYRKAGVGEDQLIVYGRKLWRFELVHPPAAGAA